MVNIIIQVFISLIIGIILGVSTIIFFFWISKKKLIKEAKKKFNLPKNLKSCLICNKLTTGDVCSVEHQQEWIKNNTQLSEGSNYPNRAGEVKTLKQDSLVQSPPNN